MYKILIADDEELEQKVLMLFLRNMGFEENDILIASSGPDAVMQIICEKPDIVLLDINMPGMTGLEVLEKIHDLSTKPKVIISTAFSEFDFAVKALKLGAIDFLVKPVKKEVLIEAITKASEKLVEDKKKNLQDINKVVEIFNKEYGSTNSKEQQLPKSVECIKLFIEENYKKRIGLDEIICNCNYSKYHISRIFKSTMGCSIMEYLIRHRISIAKSLLIDTNNCVKTIAFEVGYSDPNYFTWSFKKEVGVSPLQFRASKR